MLVLTDWLAAHATGNLLPAASHCWLPWPSFLCLASGGMRTWSPHCIWPLFNAFWAAWSRGAGLTKQGGATRRWFFLLGNEILGQAQAQSSALSVGEGGWLNGVHAGAG